MKKFLIDAAKFGAGVVIGFLIGGGLTGYKFADEGGGFVGNQLIQNGDIVEDNDYEWDSDEGIVIREAVGMCVEEDEEEVEN